MLAAPLVVMLSSSPVGSEAPPPAEPSEPAAAVPAGEDVAPVVAPPTTPVAPPAAGPTAANDVGRVAVGGGGGGVELGLVVVNRRGWIVYPFAGLGAIGYSLTLTNTSQGPRSFGDQTIAAGRALELGAGSAYVELGAGFRRLTFTRGGGFIHGAELGLMLALDQGPWKRSDGRAVGGGVPGVNMSGFYLRVDIGGGGFSWTEDVERWRQRRAERRARRG